jgi:hypothetical protein
LPAINAALSSANTAAEFPAVTPANEATDNATFLAADESYGAAY